MISFIRLNDSALCALVPAENINVLDHGINKNVIWITASTTVRAGVMKNLPRSDQTDWKVT